MRASILLLLLLVPAIGRAEEPKPDPFVPSSYPLRDPVWPPTGSYDDGFHDGMRDANHASTNEWTLAGAGSTCVMGPVGCLGTTGAAFFVDLPQHRMDEGPDPHKTELYREGYTDGYRKRLKIRRSQAAFLGGAFMVGVAYYSLVLLSAAAGH